MKKTFLFFIMVLFGFSLNAQVTTLTFSGKDADSNYVRLDSVFIINLTKSWQETIYYPDTILIMGGTGIEEYGKNPQFALSQNIPNPFSGVSDFSLQLPEDNAVTISVFDLNGRKITEVQQTLPRGTHIFRIFLSTPQTYLLSVNGGTDHASIKIINTGNGGKNRLEYLYEGNEMPITYQLKSAKGETEYPFDLGDSMEYVGYATINGLFVESEAIRQVQTGSESLEFVFVALVGDGQPCCGTPTLTDVEGNTYNTVQIGNQCWMKENLRVTQYINGTTIPLGYESSSTAYRYYPDNNIGHVPTYGYLYNWTAVMGDASSSTANPSGVQGICPIGWHVPSDAEWTQLTDYMSSQSQYQCGSNSTYIAKSLAATTGWNNASETCDVGNTPANNNTTGFSALPAGDFYDIFRVFGSSAIFWSTTQSNSYNAYYRLLNYDYADVIRNPINKYYGISVRCVRDEPSFASQLPIVNTIDAINITQTTATSGGVVLLDCGTAVTARGVCWSTSQNPTITDNHTIDGNSTGSFTSNLTGLIANTTYYVRAYATNSVGTTYGNEVSFTATFTCGRSSLTDADGNTYNTVQIGYQCWMKENLRVTKYSNGTIISLGDSTSYLTSYRYYPDNNSSNVPNYGYLYNWAAVMGTSGSSNANPSGVQGICPSGWHVPSDAEWTQLTDYVSSQSPYQCSSNSNFIAKALASQIGWDSHSGTCDVGNTLSANNATGFSALPTGNYEGGYVNFGYTVFFWSATQFDASQAYNIYLSYNSARVIRRKNTKNLGFSVRCVRDDTTHAPQLPTVNTSSAINIMTTTASCGGEVTFDGYTTVTSRGVCWSTTHNPTITNNHTSDGSGIGNFTSNLTGLTSNTTYYVRAYATNSVGTAYGSQVCFTTYIPFTCGDSLLTDIDGNGYGTVQIGNQCWMRSNLRVSKYSNGTTIPLENSYSYVTAYRCNPGNNSSNVSTYGYLYNWAAVMGGSSGSSSNPSGVQGICPIGWHVPSSDEFYVLCGSAMLYNCGYNNNFLAKALASPYGWNSSSLTCAVGNLPETNNATLFSAKPAGENYSYFGDDAYFWTASQYDISSASNINLNYNDPKVFFFNSGKTLFLSVRCVRGDSTPPAQLPTINTTAAINITQNTATCGGNVTFDGNTTVPSRGICWSTSHTPTTTDNHTSDGSGSGNFTSNLTGLTANTTYYVRAYAINSVGTAYGNEVSFSTSPPAQLPTVNTAAVTNITQTTATCGGTVTFDGYTTITSRGVCWSTSQNPTITDSHTTDGTSTGSFTSSLTGLTANTTYYVRAYATNSVGTAYGNEVGFTTAAQLPTVNTTAATNITPTTASCGGNVTFDGYTTVTSRGVCWSTSQNPTTANSHTTDGSGTGSFTSNLTGLTANTTYYVRAYAINRVGTTYGNEVSFTTTSPAQLPTVNTTAVTNITQTTATCGGNVTFDGYATVTSRGVCWSITENPTTTDNHTSDGSGTGNFTSNLTGLTANTTYYVRTYAINSVGTVYGNEVSFNTSPPAQLPTVNTAAVTNITQTTATCGGTVTFDGYTTITSRGVCWSTSQNPTITDSHTTNGSGTGSFTSSLIGLTDVTTYYVRAYATNSVGTTYGNEVCFTASFTCGSSPLTDADGNVYNTVQIGNQCWMKENLRVTQYINGTTIPLGNSPSYLTAYRYNPNNNSSNVPTYGYLYNWAAVMGASGSSSTNPSGVQGICPTGWHVPSDAEFTQLTDYVSSQSQYQCGSNSTYIAKALASQIGWNSSSSTCAVGNTPSANNTSGFSALPSGSYGSWQSYFGDDVSFWTATRYDNDRAYYRNLSYNNAYVYLNYYYKDYGFSVRCVRDAQLPIVNTAAVTSIFQNTATCGGEVLAEGITTVTARGVCWSTSQNPTTTNSHTTDGTGIGSFTSSLTGLSADTTYYVRAYATNSVGIAYGNEVSFTASFTCGNSPLTDADGNVYNTVQIGNQCWMKENLRVTEYANGTTIPLGNSISYSTAYRYNPENNSSNVPTYGHLYNWVAVMGGSGSSNTNPSGVQGICPTGWHVPSYAEWTQLINYVSSQRQYRCGDDNTYIAKSLAFQIGWHSSSATCAIGNTPSTNNTTGFSAMPAGSNDGSDEWFGDIAYFWSATMNDGPGYPVSFACQLFYVSEEVDRINASRSLGLSVRCVRDNTTLPAQLPTVNTAAVTNITQTTATCSGTVTFDGYTTITSCGVCWSTSQNPTITDSHTTDGTSTGSFTSSLTGLTPNTTYYVRAYASNSVGTAYGNEVGFTTLPPAQLPTVNTTAASSIMHTTAICGGNVTFDGNANVTSRGICWSITENPVITDNHTSDGSGTGNFTSNLTGLTANTTYYVRAYATNSVGTAYGNQISFTTASSSSFICGSSTLTDIDGNVYNTVQIGNQCWMKENLRVIGYVNGTTIPLGDIINSSTAYRYNPGNNSSNVSTYGYLYNWAAVMGGSGTSSSNPSGVQGICPIGWHVPSDAEWSQLLDYVGNQNQYQCESNNTYIAKSLASTTGWIIDTGTDTCSIGNTPSSNNATGFSALPADGYYGPYNSIGYGTYFWSATQYDDDNAYDRGLSHVYAGVYQTSLPKGNGYSVRCVRNNTTLQIPTLNTTAATLITQTSATCGGNVTFNGNANVTSRGICWSISENPIITDNHTSDGSGTGIFTSNLTGLTENTTYYVRAYATNSVGTAYGNQVSFTTASSSSPFICGSSTLTDIDGNVYNTVQIGNQCWMKENLRVIEYVNGTTIPLGNIISSSTAYRYNPGNNSSNVSTYGYLYNWAAVMGNSGTSSSNPSGVQGICPIGWHVPSDAEWSQLLDYVGSQNQYQCESNNTYIAKSLASTIGWIIDTGTDTCSIGNTPSSNNATGFSALPAEGYYGPYNSIGDGAYFWSATQYDNDNAYDRGLSYVYAGVYRTSLPKGQGLSVRCVRD